MKDVDRAAARFAPTRVVPRARLWLAAILLLAAAVRLGGVFHDLPFSFYGDELYMMKKAVAMGTGDLNPHWFHKPAFLMYLLLAAYGGMFLAGLATGAWSSPDAFGAAFLADYGPFLLIGRLVVLAFGVGLVAAVYLLARRGLRDERAGLAAALVTAVLPPLVASSQVIKSDVPCAFLMMLAIWAYLGRRESTGWRPAVLAGAFAGVAMGTHYYALALLPPFAAAEIGIAVRRGRGWLRGLGGAALLAAVFLAGFFVSSPYNLLDPQWTSSMVTKVEGMVPDDSTVHYEPDSETSFRPGPASWGAAFVHLLGVLGSAEAMGWPWLALAAVGLGAVWRRPEGRWFAALVAGIGASFALFTVTAAPFHVQPRHLASIYPLVATMVWPGALALGRGLARVVPAVRRPATAAAALAGALALPALAMTVLHDRREMRLDSRVVAHRWIVETLPRDARIVLDHYGPELAPSPPAVERQQAILQEVPPGPFTEPQATRLDLLARFPPDDAFDMDELGHPWWLPHEESDEVLRGSARHRDMGNPLISRVPKTLEAYRREGVRYVITNSVARSRYFHPEPREEAFPSFVRFYRQLAGLEPVVTFDPATWGGEGPVVWVYDLGSGSAGTRLAGATDAGGSTTLPAGAREDQGGVTTASVSARDEER